MSVLSICRFIRRTLRAVVLPAALAVFAPIFFHSCAGGGNPAGAGGHDGAMEIRARMVSRQLSKSMSMTPCGIDCGAADGVAGVLQTVADRFVIEVSGGDLAPTRIESERIDFSRPTVVDTIKNLPVGRNRRVAIWAVDRSGNVVTHIDTVEFHTVNIEAASVARVMTALIPAAGSIYLQFGGLKTDIATVHAVFTADDGTVIAENSVNRAARTFMSLDNIQHQTSGVLRVSIIGGNGDTLFIANRALTFDARADHSIDLQFMENSGMISLEVEMVAPGVTSAAFNFGGSGTTTINNSNGSESTVIETGELIITEIMWNATNDNYIEAYNPSDAPVFFDVLTTDIDGTRRDFADVTVAAGGYLVIGRREMPHTDLSTQTTGGLPIAGTGNWITLRRGDGSVVDRVICSGSNAALGWPGVSGRRSIELSRDKYDVIDNNFGKNWRVTGAAAPLPGMENEQFGTPGSL